MFSSRHQSLIDHLSRIVLTGVNMHAFLYHRVRTGAQCLPRLVSARLDLRPAGRWCLCCHLRRLEWRCKSVVKMQDGESSMRFSLSQREEGEWGSNIVCCLFSSSGVRNIASRVTALRKATKSRDGPGTHSPNYHAEHKVPD